MLTAIFQKYSSAVYWKIDYIITNQYTNGMVSLILKTNLLPTNGSCSIDQNNGTSLLTWFTIVCSNWYDPDGSVKTYEYFGMICVDFLIKTVFSHSIGRLTHFYLIKLHIFFKLRLNILKLY